MRTYRRILIMSKQKTEQSANVPRRSFLKKERIPNVEWLFGYGDARKQQGNGFLRKLLCRDWAKLLYSTLLFLLQHAPIWILPLVTSDVIDTLTNRPEGYIQRLIIDAAILFVLIAQNIPVTMWRSSILNNWIRTTTSEIRSGVIRKLQRLSITYHKEIEEGKIQSKLLRDIENVTTYFTNFTNSFLTTVVSLIVATVIAVFKNPVITLFFAVLIPTKVLLLCLFKKPISNRYHNFREENESLSTKITTTLQMLSLTKAHGLIAHEELLVNEKIFSVQRAGIKLDKTNALFGSVLFFVNSFFSIACLFVCVILCLNDYLTVGEVVLFQSLFSSISGNILSLINIFPSLTAGKEAVRSLSEIVCATDIEKDDGTLPVPQIYGDIRFDNVSYHYPNEEKAVVKNLSFHVRQGEKIAVVGSSGSGKSTLMNLIIGLLSPTEGQILIDGEPLTNLPLQSYRRFISVVPQNSILFSGTIRDNITFGLSQYSEETLQKVVQDANINEFLSSLPHGLDTQVGERGDKLSGGQKQRISIARALIRNPSILILDEATSALDNVSEHHVQCAIEKLTSNRTTFIVAHRLSTIRNADKIIVMENGEVVETGTYETLMALNGKFAELERLSRIRESE